MSNQEVIDALRTIARGSMSWRQRCALAWAIGKLMVAMQIGKQCEYCEDPADYFDDRYGDHTCKACRDACA